MSFWVKFWGVRGSIACPAPTHMAFGGNTSCLQVEAAGEHIILDAGTGIRGLGAAYMQEGVREATLLLTHTHWDHINGFPFFAPVFQADRSFRVMAGHLREPNHIESVLSGQMATPTFTPSTSNTRKPSPASKGPHSPPSGGVPARWTFS